MRHNNEVLRLTSEPPLKQRTEVRGLKLPFQDGLHNHKLIFFLYVPDRDVTFLSDPPNPAPRATAPVVKDTLRRGSWPCSLGSQYSSTKQILHIIITSTKEVE